MVFSALLSLNILNMRSVIRNPPTTLLMAAATAIVPSTVRKRALGSAGNDDGAHHHNRVQRVGQRHQRRVQQRRDSADHFKSDESRQHEDIQAVDEVERHRFLLRCSGQYCQYSRSTRVLG